MAWEYLDLVRVYTKPKGKLPDFNEPVVLHRGRCSVEDFVNKVSGWFWGAGAGIGGASQSRACAFCNAARWVAGGSRGALLTQGSA